MIGNYVMSAQRDGDVKTWIYPVGADLRCMADLLAALMAGYVVLIEPPGGKDLRGVTGRVRD